MIKRLALAAALVAVMATAASAFPAPHTPCWAISQGRDPSAHMRYWNAAGWHLDAVGRWTQHGGAGCWGDP